MSGQQVLSTNGIHQLKADLRPILRRGIRGRFLHHALPAPCLINVEVGSKYETWIGKIAALPTYCRLGNKGGRNGGLCLWCALQEMYLNHQRSSRTRGSLRAAHWGRHANRDKITTAATSSSRTVPRCSINPHSSASNYLSYKYQQKFLLQHYLVNTHLNLVASSQPDDTSRYCADSLDFL